MRQSFPKSSRLKWNSRQTLIQFSKQLSKLHGSSTYQPHFPYPQILFTYIGSFLGIAALAYLSVKTNYPPIAAPFGATAVLVFAVPESLLAQPRNTIGGNLIGAVVCLIFVSLFGSQPWVMGLAVATSIKVMQLTKTLHPPAVQLPSLAS
ncbi:MAG: HPP family protein [Oscillatoriaceae cyanobacterium Prado104]|jgi:CBS-domain-containing membrane protein|nr:HPP family protein [Oscillatoriaceae cyanobacterium Prado104]